MCELQSVFFVIIYVMYNSLHDSELRSFHGDLDAKNTLSGRKGRKHDLIKKLNIKIFIVKLCAGIPTIHNNCKCVGQNK